MKKCLILLLMLGSFTVFAADSPFQKMTHKDRAKMLGCVKQLDFALHNSMFFAGRECVRDGFIDAQLGIMKTMLAKYSISYPIKLTYGWLDQLKGDLSQVEFLSKEENPDDEAASTVCDISGLKKADVLRVLYQAAGLGGAYPSKSKDAYSQSEFEKAVSGTLDFDYFGGRLLKVDLSGDSFDSHLYDRDNGQGAAYKAIKQLRS